MAKIQKYSVIGSSKRSNGGYVKVSELREWIEKKIQFMPASSRPVPYMKEREAQLKELLAAIDTEGK